MKRPTDTFNADHFNQLPLRARKAAQVRLALVDAVLTRLAKGPLPTVNVKECCAEVGVSEPTFFNYFGSKTGSLVFFVQLWSIEAQWRLTRAKSEREGLQELFDRTADGFREVQWLIPEIVVYQIRTAGLPQPGDKMPAPPSVADKLLRFGDLDGIEDLEPLGIQHIFAACLQRAVHGGELPPRTDLKIANQLLLSLFFGAAACQWDADRVAETLSRGLALMWRSFSAPTT